MKKLSYKQKYLLLRNGLAMIFLAGIYAQVIVNYLEKVGIVC